MLPLAGLVKIDTLNENLITIVVRCDNASNTVWRFNGSIPKPVSSKISLKTI
jgi:hypothetical protein